MLLTDVAEGLQAADMADQLLDLQRMPGLAVPRDPGNLDDPAVFVLPKDDADEWVAQVLWPLWRQRCSLYGSIPEALAVNSCALNGIMFAAFPLHGF